MMSLDQMAGKFERVSVSGIPCIFSSMRIDRSTIPEGRYMYEVAGDDDGGEEPAWIGPEVLCHFIGTLICDEPLPIGEDGTMAVENGDFIWNPMPDEEAHFPIDTEPCRGDSPQKVHVRDIGSAKDMGAGMKYMKDVYQILIENLTNERLDQIVFRDKDAFIMDKKLDEVLEQYHKLGLPEKDAGVIDRAFELYAEQSALFVHAAYKQGMEDAVKLLKEMGVFGK